MSDENKPRSIIAMKGPPFTGKTETASLIAASLKCPVLSLDDFLEDLNPDYFQTPFPSSSSSLARDLAFKIICRIADSHLSKGLVDNIVIDSPLSSQSHLDQLIMLASCTPKTRLVIIECKPYNEYKWQDRFEQFLEANSDSWYKAKDWDEVMKAVNDDDDERSDNYKVSKLVFDPFSVYQLDLCYLTYSLLWKGKPIEPPPFMEAINYMITRVECEGPYIVDYNQWRQSKYLPPNESRQNSSRQEFCSDGHHSITNYTENLGLENEEPNCTVCEQVVTGAAYTCTACSLALHKECVEPSSTLQPPCITEDTVRLPCTSCKKVGERESSSDCESCRFESKLRKHAYEQVASVIRHDCEEHFLVFDVSSSLIQCMACGVVEINDMYSCKICGVAYHYKCLTEVARQVKHVHGGHQHRMLLKFSSEEAEEDYLCHECLEKRDPELWFYSCQDCPYEIHLRCALDGIVQDEEK